MPQGIHHVDLLEPFWGNLKPFAVAQGMDRNEIYKKTAFSLFAIIEEIENSDFLLLPADYKFYKNHHHILAEINRLSKKHKKQVVIFSHSDRHQSINLPNTITFRTSAYRSLNKPGVDYAMPFSFGDLLKFYNHGKVVTREKREKPVIGFCGNVVKGRVKAVAKRIVRGPRDGFDYTKLRTTAINVLSQTEKVDANFILRNSHFAGAAHGHGIDEVKKVFYNNLINSDYLIALRGNGNYSYRFYEIMQCGRIPFLIDTDCDFPFDQQVQIRKYIPVINHTDVKHCAEYIAWYHHSLGHEEFVSRQRMMRSIWESWYTNHGFFEKLHNFLISGNE